MKTSRIITINVFITLIIIVIWLIILDTQRYNMFQNFQKQLLNIKSDDHQTIELTGSNINLYAMQEGIVSNLSKAKESVVNILATKDIKLYFENPDSMYKPWTVHTQESELGKWSGIIISKDWYIITNKHVVEDLEADYSVITDNKNTYKVKKIRLDPTLDIAILKIDINDQTSLIPANFVSIKDEINEWQFVFSIGNSQWTNNLTMGILWDKNTTLNIKNNSKYIWMYQSDTLINPGDSWWPLIDIYGNVIGINTAIQGFTNQYTYSLPLYKELIFSTIKSIHNYSKIVRPYLWIDYKVIDKQIKKDFDLQLDEGIYIKDSIFDSISYKVWLKHGDIITQINNEPLLFDVPFIYQLYVYGSWDLLKLEVYRDGKLINIDLNL